MNPQPCGRVVHHLGYSPYVTVRLGRLYDSTTTHLIDFYKVERVTQYTIFLYFFGTQKIVKEAGWIKLGTYTLEINAIQGYGYTEHA